MLFQPEHIDQIRRGEKTQTRRDWSENYARPNVGSIQIASTEMFTSDAEADCYIRITDHWREQLGDMLPTDAEAEGGYSLAEFREVWAELHGEWDPDLHVDVVEFEYVGTERQAEVEGEQKVLGDGGRHLSDTGGGEGGE
jgi:hypothetical protein